MHSIRWYALFALLLFGTLIFGPGLSLYAQAVYPGLYKDDGTPHPVHTPNPVTGKSLNVLDYGADPQDNEYDDREAIANALQDASYGDEIYFPAGVYNIRSTEFSGSGTHFTLKSGVNLRGSHMDSTILKSGFGDLTVDQFFKCRGVHDIQISHLYMTAEFTGSFSTNTSVNNPQRGGPKYMISIDDASGIANYHITIDSVYFEHFWRMGVRLSDSHDIVVKNCVFTRATDVAGGGAGYGISIQGNSRPDTDSKFNLVQGCQFLGPYIRHGVVLQYSTHNNLVAFNVARDNRLDAIDLHGEDEFLNEVAFNEIYDVTKGAGVGVGNTGATHDESGPYNYIHDNIMVNCREGVKVYLGSPHTRIENNTVTSSGVPGGKGIYILNGPYTIVKGNHVYDNNGANFTGILLNYDGGTRGKADGPPRFVQVLENDIHDNDYGVRIMAGKGIVYENNEVYDNRQADFISSNSVTFHKLIDTRVEGEGMVILDPPGGSYEPGTEVQLTAQPLPNNRFLRWSIAGRDEFAQNPFTLTVDTSLTVTAVFEEKTDSDEVLLTLLPSESGTVRTVPEGPVFDRGTVVQLTALPDSGRVFDHWQGDLSGAQAVDTLIMDSDKTVQAVFKEIPTFELSAWIIGSGTVTLDPPGGTYIQGTRVILTAIPDQGWQFKSWSGPLGGSANPDTLVMDQDKVFMATFEPATGIASDTRVAASFALEQNYPNPFNATTQIRFSLKQPEYTTLAIYDLTGRQIRQLVSRKLDRGWHTITFDATNLPSGLYWVRLQAGAFREMKKMVLVK